MAVSSRKSVLPRLLMPGLLALAPMAQGQTWTGAAGSNWSTPSNWVGATVPASASTTSVVFGSGSVNTTSFVDTAWTLNTLTFSTLAHSLSGSTITFDGSSALLSLGSASHSIANNLFLASDVAIENTGDVTLGSAISGPGSLAKMGPGMLRLSGPTSHSGSTTIAPGSSLALTGPASRTLGQVIDNGALYLYGPGSTAFASPMTGSGALYVYGGSATGTFAHSGLTSIVANAQVSGTINSSGVVDVSGALNSTDSMIGGLIGVQGGRIEIGAGSLTLGSNSNIGTTYRGSVSGSGSLKKVGSSTQTLAGPSLSGGPITIENGMLVLGDSGPFGGPGGSGPSAIGSVVTNGWLALDVKGGITIADPVTGTGHIALWTGKATGTFLHTGLTTISSDSTLEGTIAGTSVLTIDGTLLTTSATASSLHGSSSALIDLTSGTMRVTGGGGTYLGTITGAGSLAIDGPVRQTLAGPRIDPSISIKAGATLELGNNLVGPPSVQAILNNGSLELDVPPPGVTLSGAVTGSGAVYIGGAARGQLQHQGYTFISPAGRLDGSIANGVALFLDGTLNTNGSTVGSLSGGGFLTLGTGTFTLGSDNTDKGFSGVISGTGRVVKVGTGRLTLNGTSTVTGGVDVEAGTLVMVGTLPGPLTLKPGATLVGSGGTTGNLQVEAGARVSMDSVTTGMLATGNLRLAGTLETRINNPSAGFNRIATAGTVDLRGAALSLSGTYAPAQGETFTLIANDGQDPVVGTFAGLGEGALLQHNGKHVFISYVAGTGNDVAITAASVPGPPLPGVAIPGNASVTVTFGPPLGNGGAPVTGYTATCGARTASGPASPIVVTGLSNGVQVTCRVYATNVVGNGPDSYSLASITPLAKPLLTRFYEAILGRDADPAGLAFWNAEALRMAALGANVNETWYAMAIAFFDSAEYRKLGTTDADYVDDLYLAFLDRLPDDAGRAFWVGRLSQGMSRGVMLLDFLFSREFTGFTRAIYGDNSVRAEIDVVMDFYRGALGRLPDDEGFRYWIASFRAAQCEGPAAIVARVTEISSLFFTSAEYSVRNRSSRDYISDLYNAFMRRGSDLAGQQFWESRLDAGMVDRAQLRAEFISSPEFQGRVQAIIGQGCMP